MIQGLLYLGIFSFGYWLGIKGQRAVDEANMLVLSERCERLADKNLELVVENELLRLQTFGYRAMLRRNNQPVPHKSFSRN